jgi:MFS family permease
VTTAPSPRADAVGREGLDASRLGHRYIRLFCASTISNLGDGISMIAYPWLASAITRNPVLISLVAVVQRLPWLLFSLPAGVITDRYDRKRLMVGSNVLRTLATIAVALAVLARSDALPSPDVISDAATVITTDNTLYVLILLATLFIGIGEVLYDNSAQTFLPSIVHADNLEKANGRMWSAEVVANTFAGPPLAALLIATSFALPFFADAATFAVSAVLIATIRTSRRVAAVTATESTSAATTSWTVELREGFRWLWGHDLLRTLAIVLGFLNLIGAVSMATFVLFGQEVLGTSATEFAILGTGAAFGGVLGGWTASAVARRIGAGPSLALTLAGGGVFSIGIGLMSSWPPVWLMMTAYIYVGTLWNVITVSFRQAVIPDHLLGRVNSVYRFFGWGMMPIGAALGGVIVVAVDAVASRELALRTPWLAAGVMSLLLLAAAGPRLTTEKFAAARAAAVTTATPDAE